jgi:phage virion morphogenesis protein
MIRITLKSNDLEGLLKQASERASKKSPLMREIAAHMQDAVEQNFQSEGRPPWADLSKSTKQNRKAKGKWPGRKLQVSGQLVNSVSSDSSETKAIVGTNKVYAAIQQFGGVINRAARSETFQRSRFKRGKKKGRFKKGSKSGQGFSFKSSSSKIPARPFIGLADVDMERIKNSIVQFLMRTIGR